MMLGSHLAMAFECFSTPTAHQKAEDIGLVLHSSDTSAATGIDLISRSNTQLTTLL